MVETGLLLRIFERDFVVKLLFGVLLCSLLILADGFVLYLLARLFGVLLVLAAEATLSLVATFVVIDAARRLLERMRTQIREGVYPLKLFRATVGCLAGGILLIVPGFLSSAVGLLLFVPGMRYLTGTLLTSNLGTELPKVYEFLKLSEFEREPDAVRSRDALP
jgi:UPF0716 protein FxsA